MKIALKTYFLEFLKFMFHVQFINLILPFFKFLTKVNIFINQYSLFISLKWLQILFCNNITWTFCNADVENEWNALHLYSMQSKRIAVIIDTQQKFFFCNYKCRDKEIYVSCLDISRYSEFENICNFAQFL